MISKFKKEGKMKTKIKYGTMDEVLRNELENPKYFKGGQPVADISAWAKKMKEYDPDGKKAAAIAEKYRKR